MKHKSYCTEFSGPFLHEATLRHVFTHGGHYCTESVFVLSPIVTALSGYMCVCCVHVFRGLGVGGIDVVTALGKKQFSVCMREDW